MKFLITTASALLVAGGGLLAAPAPPAHACVAINAGAAAWGGTTQTCLPDGGKMICDRGGPAIPFVGAIENCFVAYPGHPRY